MTDFADIAATAFAGHSLLASGPLDLVALAVRKAEREGADGPLLVFDDASGRVIDLDLRGSEADVLARLADRGAAKPGPAQAQEKPRGRGRPKLGVVGREVTLLPRHWDWLEQQPASASQVIRRLIDAARRAATESGQPQCIVIVDASAVDLAVFRMAGAKVLSLASARAKAQTAASIAARSDSVPEAVRPAIAAATKGTVTGLPVTAPCTKRTSPRDSRFVGWFGCYLSRKYAALISMYLFHSSGRSSSAKIASTGHSGSQAPQSMHSSGSM